MSSIQDDIKAIEGLRSSGEDLDESKRTAQAEERERLTQLRERIKGGESTGDRIRDYVIIAYGLNPEVEQKFRELEAELAGHGGEFVLMVTKREHFPGCTGFGHKPRDDEYVVEEEIYIGVVGEVQLTLDTTRIHGASIPMDSHVLCRDLWRSEVKLVDGNMAPGFVNDLALIDVELKRRSRRLYLHDDGPDYFVEVKVGDDEVRAWFEAKGKKYLVVLQKAAKLLGRPLDQSPELDAELASKRASVTAKLIELSGEHTRLQKQLAESQQQFSRTQAPSPNKIREVEKSIKKLLAEAVELDMSDAVLVSVPTLLEQFEMPAS